MTDRQAAGQRQSYVSNAIVGVEREEKKIHGKCKCACCACVCVCIGECVSIELEHSA